MEGLHLTLWLLYKHTHSRLSWHPPSCDLSSCNSIALVMIIALGAVISNLSAFLLVTVFLFFLYCSSLCLDGC